MAETMLAQIDRLIDAAIQADNLRREGMRVYMPNDDFMEVMKEIYAMPLYDAMGIEIPKNTLPFKKFLHNSCGVFRHAGVLMMSSPFVRVPTISAIPDRERGA